MPCKNHQHKPWPRSGNHHLAIEACETTCGWCAHETTSASNLRAHARRHIKNPDEPSLHGITIPISKAGRKRLRANDIHHIGENLTDEQITPQPVHEGRDDSDVHQPATNVRNGGETSHLKARITLLETLLTRHGIEIPAVMEDRVQAEQQYNPIMGIAVEGQQNLPAVLDASDYSTPEPEDSPSPPEQNVEPSPSRDLDEIVKTFTDSRRLENILVLSTNSESGTRGRVNPLVVHYTCCLVLQNDGECTCERAATENANPIAVGVSACASGVRPADACTFEKATDGKFNPSEHETDFTTKQATDGKFNPSGHETDFTTKHYCPVLSTNTVHNIGSRRTELVDE